FASAKKLLFSTELFVDEIGYDSVLQLEQNKESVCCSGCVLRHLSVDGVLQPAFVRDVSLVCL
ncbi:hypothetical protein HDU91_007132, partial [Kappamyces sp. JEL0680]